MTLQISLRDKISFVYIYLLYKFMQTLNSIVDNVWFPERGVYISGEDSNNLNRFYYFYKLIWKVRPQLIEKYFNTFSDKTIYNIIYRGNSMNGAVICSGSLMNIFKLIDYLVLNIEDVVRTKEIFSAEINTIDYKECFDSYFRTELTLRNKGLIFENINIITDLDSITKSINALAREKIQSDVILIKSLRRTIEIPISNKSKIIDLYE